MSDWLPDVAPKVEREVPGVAEISEGWQARLIAGARGKPAPLLANLLVALRYAPEWRGVLAHDESAHRTVALKPAPWGMPGPFPRVWNEQSDIELAEWAQHNGIFVSPLQSAQAVQVVAAKNSFHPIRDYLDGLRWDGGRRIDTWTSAYLGAVPGEYSAAVGSRWLIGAVARVFKPGCKNDCALILEGPQGAKKSTALRTLGQPWFSDDLGELGSKDAALQVRGTWIIELAELDSLSRSDVGRIKSFMARSVDRFRPPYGHRLVELPRESVFCGSVNLDSYLRDETGARRFWPIRCGAIDIGAIEENRDQLWAEAVVCYREGMPWWLDKRLLIEAAEAQQAERFEGASAWDGIIPDWIAGRENVSIDEILHGCVNKPAERWTQADRTAIGRTLRALGWERYRLGSRKARLYRYRASASTLAARAGAEMDADVDAAGGLF